MDSRDCKAAEGEWHNKRMHADERLLLVGKAVGFQEPFHYDLKVVTPFAGDAQSDMPPIVF